VNEVSVEPLNPDLQLAKKGTPDIAIQALALR